MNDFMLAIILSLKSPQALNGIHMHVILNSNREYYRTTDGLHWQPDPSLAGKFDKGGFIKTNNYPDGRVIPQRPPTPPPAYVAPPLKKTVPNCWATAKTLGSPTKTASPIATHTTHAPVSPVHGLATVVTGSLSFFVTFCLFLFCKFVITRTCHRHGAKMSIRATTTTTWFSSDCHLVMPIFSHTTCPFTSEA
jgi:hypothetical protein